MYLNLQLNKIISEMELEVYIDFWNSIR